MPVLFGPSVSSSPVIHLRGFESSLCGATLERLLRSQAIIVVPPQFFEQLKLRYADDVEYGRCELYSSDSVQIEPGHRVLLFGYGPFDDGLDGEDGFGIDGIEVVLILPGSGSYQEKSEWIDSVVRVYDLLTQKHDSVWNRSELGHWVSSLQSAQTPMRYDGEAYWWISEIDVADALIRIVVSSEAFPDSVKISGRRKWSSEQTFEELSLLFNRTQAGLTGQFGVEHLTSAPTPYIEVEKLMITDEKPMSVEENAHIRPDLSDIHDVLVRIDGDGWRPLVPIRTALMHHIAAFF